MTTFDVRVHDIFSDGEDAITKRPLFAALIVAEPRDLNTPFAFHTGLIGGEYLEQLRKLQALGTISVDMEDGFFDSDIYHQRNDIIRGAFKVAGII